MSETNNANINPSQEQLEYQATHDKLTGLYNLAGFEAATSDLAKAKPGEYAVLYVDLDDLKKMNDTHGHEVGDMLIQAATSNLITTSIRHETSHDETDRQPDVAARLGGDEFAIALRNLSENEAQDGLNVVVDRLRNKLADAGVKASIGGAIHEEGETVKDVMNRADKLMFEDKSARKQQAFEALPRRKQVAAKLGMRALRYAGMNPPR